MNVKTTNAGVQTPDSPTITTPGGRTDAGQAKGRDLKASLLVGLLVILAMEVASRFVPDYIMPSPLIVGRTSRSSSIAVDPLTWMMRASTVFSAGSP